MKNKGAFKGVIIAFLLLLIGTTLYLGLYFFNMRDLDFMLGRVRINESSNVTYSVSLKNEDYRNNRNSDIYVTNLIKKINTSFNYYIAFNENVVGDYSYYITGRLESLDEGGNTLINKDLYVKDGYKSSVNSKVINMSSSFDIDFAEYKEIYDDLVNEYDIKLDANIIFDIKIAYNVYNEVISKDITGEETLTVKIPLGSDTTSVSVPDKSIIKKTAYSDAKNEYSSIYFIISLEFFGASLLFMLVLVLILKNLYGNISEYEKELGKIISKYKGRLVKIRELPDLSKSDVLFVDDMDTLDDAAINIMSPINFCEVIKGREAVFIVFKDDKAYVYKLSLVNEDTE